MALKLTLLQIADINQRDLGINGRFYEDVEGYIYIGKGTRLFKYAKCSEVSLDLATIPGATNVCEALNILSKEIDGIEIRVTDLEDGLFGKIWAVNTLMNCC